jgi:hypothetical protein
MCSDKGDLPKLDLQTNRGTDFKAWKTQWEANLSLSGFGFDDEAQSKQVKALTLCFPDGLLLWWTTWGSLVINGQVHKK